MGSKVSRKLKIAWRSQQTLLEAHLGQILGPCCAKLGPKFDQVGAKLGQDGTKLDQVGAKLSQVGAKIDQVGAKKEPDWTRWTNMADKTAKLDRDRAKLVQVATHDASGEPTRTACSFTIVNNVAESDKAFNTAAPLRGRRI